MLAPKKVKFRKMQKGRRRGLAYRGSTINFGDYALIALEAGWVSSRQIESARVAISFLTALMRIGFSRRFVAF